MLMILMEKRKKVKEKFVKLWKMCIFATENQKNVTIMTVNMFTAWWWRYSRFNKS